MEKEYIKVLRNNTARKKYEKFIVLALYHSFDIHRTLYTNAHSAVPILFNLSYISLFLSLSHILSFFLFFSLSFFFSLSLSHSHSTR